MGPGRRATTTRSKVASSEAPTRGASSSARVAVSSDAPTSQPVPSTEGSSTGSTSKKRGRGPSRGKNAERLRAAHGPLDVLILDRVGVPVGVNSAKVMTEIGFLARTFAPIRNVHKWKQLTEEEKAPLIAQLLTKFNIREYHEKVGVRKSIDKKFAARYRDHRYHMHMYYKDLVESGVDPKTKPYGDVSQEDWEYTIETLYKDPKFQAKAKKNAENRAKLPYNHSMGSKSFQAALYERRDPTTDEPPHIVDFFHDSHVNKKGEWVSAEAESRYEQMKELSTQNLEEGVEPLTQDEIACTVLGSRPGYKKGFGHGPKPLSSNTSFKSSAEYRQQADMIKELQATVDSLQKERDEMKEKLEKFENAQQKFEDAQQKFEDSQQQMMQQLLQMQLQMQRALPGISTNAYMPPES